MVGNVLNLHLRRLEMAKGWLLGSMAVLGLC